MKVLAYGEILFDVIDGVKHIGGAPLNFAAHFVQCGGQSVIVSRIGNDENGQVALKAVADLGIDPKYIQIDDDHATGLVTVTTTNGQPAYEIKRNVAFDLIQGESIAINPQEYSAFYFGTLIQRNTISKQSLYHILDNYTFQDIFYDINIRKDNYTLEDIANSLERCTILKLNDEEVEMLSMMLYSERLDNDAFLHGLFSDYTQLDKVIITEGGQGCHLFTRKESYFSASEKITVVDTVGAGDSFSAGFLASYLKHGDAERSLRIANRIGGFVASHHGAIPAYDNTLLDLLK